MVVWDNLGLKRVVCLVGEAAIEACIVPGTSKAMIQFGKIGEFYSGEAIRPSGDSTKAASNGEIEGPGDKVRTTGISS